MCIATVGIVCWKLTDNDTQRNNKSYCSILLYDTLGSSTCRNILSDTVNEIITDSPYPVLSCVSEGRLLKLSNLLLFYAMQ
jgi:hypothetical protein